MADSLQSGLDQIFGQGTPIVDPEEPGGIPDDLTTLILKANDLFNRSQEAQQKGDWAEYGRLLNELEKVLKDLEVLQVGDDSLQTEPEQNAVVE